MSKKWIYMKYRKEKYIGGREGRVLKKN